MRSSISLTWCILPWMMAATACQADGSVPTVGFYKLDDQRLTGETIVIGEKGGFSDLTVLVTIDTKGKVTAATSADNYQNLDPAPALSLVHGWTFRPQEFDGKPVNAVGRVSVTYRERPIHQLHFPKTILLKPQLLLSVVHATAIVPTTESLCEAMAWLNSIPETITSKARLHRYT
jgi:hypothetical protein